MASAYVYGLKTLNDNWFEDRLQPSGSLTALGDIGNKATRKYESEIAYIGERYDVLARIARIPPKVSYGVPDDGFRENQRTSSVDFAHPRSRKEFVAKPPEKPTFITTESIPEVCYEDRRPVPGSYRGFGAVLSRHEESHGQRNWNTTSGDTFGVGMGSRSKSMPRLDPAQSRSAGVGTEDAENAAKGMKVGVMCGEEYADRGEPSRDTKTQRSWLYQQDASLRNLHHAGATKKKLTPVDNHLSLPLGEGAMSKIRDDLKARQGRLYRVATEITKGRDKRPGIAIFKDDP
jgi:hypothetical protein